MELAEWYRKDISKQVASDDGKHVIREQDADKAAEAASEPVRQARETSWQSVRWVGTGVGGGHSDGYTAWSTDVAWRRSPTC